MLNSSLVIVGSGIKFMSHLTTEAKTYIEQSDKVLYLVNEPVMQEWIQSVSSNAESLDGIYHKYKLRRQSYIAITDYILQSLRKEQHVCVVLYGHPTVFAQPALDAVIQAKKEGYYAKVLPGISAEDCLFADLLIDPGEYGCQSYEATDFLIRTRPFSNTSHLVLWQVGVIGALDHPNSHDNSKGAKLLFDYLSEQYSLTHEVTLYEASQYPHIDAKINKLPLEMLAKTDIPRIATLYVPPMIKSFCSEQMLEQLEINLSELQ